MEELREVGGRLEAGLLGNLGDGDVGACKKVHCSPKAQCNLVFEWSHAVVGAEALPEQGISHVALLRKGGKVDHFAKVVRDVEVCAADRDIVGGLAVQVVVNPFRLVDGFFMV